MSFLPFAVKQIQRGTISNTGVGTGTATLANPVNLASAIVYQVGLLAGSGPNANGQFGRLSLTGVSTVTVTDLGNTINDNPTISWVVVEFFPQFIKSIQNMVVPMTGGVATTNTAITAVIATKAMVLYQGAQITTNTAGGDIDSERLQFCEITSTTNLRMIRYASNNAVTFGAVVLEFL